MRNAGLGLLSAATLNVILAAQPTTSCPSPASLRIRLGTAFAAQDSARLGQWYFDRKLFSCAASAFEAADRTRAGNPSYAYLWGLSLQRAGQLEASLEPLKKAAQLDPANPAPHIATGEALDSLGRRSDAEAEWHLALAVDPSAATALDHLSADLLEDKDYLGVISLLGARKPGNTLSMPQTLNLGEALALLARLNEAIEILKDGLQRFPGSVPLSDEMATVQILAGQQEVAYETLMRTLKEHPGDRATEALYLRSLISGKSEKAGQLAEQLIAEHPRDAEILYLGASLAWSTDKLAQAEELVKRSLDIDASDYKAQQLYGTLLSQAGDLKGAQEHLLKAISLGDPEPDVRYQLSRIQTKLGDLDGSKLNMEAYRKIKASDKGRIDTAEDIERGDQALRDGDAAGAATLYRKALELSPNEALIHYKLSRALDKLHQLVEERSELQRSIELDPNFGEALNQMGYLSAHDGDPQRAEEFFLAATRAAPSYIVAWNNLAATLASEAKWKQAEDAADHALQIDPLNGTAKKVKASIAASQSTPE
jgi:Flp pilus assembly protein TadD